MVTPALKIASRGSRLALWQANFVRDALVAADPALDTEVVVVQTKGDAVTDLPLAAIGDRGLFTREVDNAVLHGKADLAVHSLKDLPTTLGEGLTLVAVTRREDARDVLIGGAGRAGTIATLPAGARVGTSSLRRRAQLMSLRRDLQVEDLRGNLDTRMERLDHGDFDAIVLAAAGILRLGWQDRVTEWLDPARWLPAVGQGALAVVARAEDARTAERLAPLHDVAAGCAVAAERALLRELEGGCQVPIGALASVDGEVLHLAALVATLDGTRTLRRELTGALGEPEALGRRVADALRSDGADEILREVRGRESLPGAPES